jgi:hypothetical protein
MPLYNLLQLLPEDSVTAAFAERSALTREGQSDAVGQKMQRTRTEVLLASPNRHSIIFFIEGRRT